VLVLEQYWPVAAATLGLIALALALSIFLRLRGASVQGRRGSRLAVSEYHEIDQNRRLVLVRRDAVEHLLLIGGAQDLVVETDIAAQDAPAAAEPRPSRFRRLRRLDETEAKPVAASAPAAGDAADLTQRLPMPPPLPPRPLEAARPAAERLAPEWPNIGAGRRRCRHPVSTAIGAASPRSSGRARAMRARRSGPTTPSNLRAPLTSMAVH